MSPVSIELAFVDADARPIHIHDVPSSQALEGVEEPLQDLKWLVIDGLDGGEVFVAVDVQNKQGYLVFDQCLNTYAWRGDLLGFAICQSLSQGAPCSKCGGVNLAAITGDFCPNCMIGEG
jgi:hypothetical protein